MTPEKRSASERLKGMENESRDLLAGSHYYVQKNDLVWLVARVKKLEAALEFYSGLDHQHCDYGVIARKALEDEVDTKEDT